MDKTNIEQLKKLGKIFNTDKVLTTEDMQELLKGILAIMASFKKDNEVLNKETKKEVKDVFEAVVKKHKESEASISEADKKSRKEAKAELDSAVKECKKIMQKILDMKPKDGVDGEDGEDGSPDTGLEIVDKLEGLKDGEKLSINAIDELAEILEELSKKIKEIGSAPSTGGGRVVGGRVIRFIDDETPVGTVDGVNADFKTTKTPQTGSLKVYRNGSRMRVTEDYTFSYRTITFINVPQVGEIILVDYRY